jgi:hypothetical protein
MNDLQRAVWVLATVIIGCLFWAGAIVISDIYPSLIGAGGAVIAFATALHLLLGRTKGK